jgi:hypothetical protein
MKVLRVSVLLIICLGGLAAKIYAQPCAGFSVNVYVRDQAFKTVANARVEAFRLLPGAENKVFTRSVRFINNSYRLDFDLPELGEFFKEDFILKASAKGLKTGEMKVHFPECATKTFEFVLKPVNSQSSADTTELESLVGKLTDKRGKAVPFARVKAKSAGGFMKPKRIMRAITRSICRSAFTKSRSKRIKRHFSAGRRRLPRNSV